MYLYIKFVFIYLLVYTRSGMAGSGRNSIFNLMRDRQDVFQSDYTFRQSHQRGRKLGFLPIASSSSHCISFLLLL